MSHKYVGGEEQGSSNMAQENQDGGLISRYLLGRLQENELEQLEERMMVDTEFYEQVLLAEDEMVEAYVNSDLPERDVADFRASFLSTAEGRQKVAYAKAMHEYVPNHSSNSDEAERENGKAVATALEIKTVAKGTPETERQKNDQAAKVRNISRPAWWRRPALAPYLAAAAAVMVIGVGFGIWQLISPSEVSKGSKTLAYAYRDQRPLEARISGFDYAPASTTRGGEPKVDRTARNLAESILLDAVLKHPNAATHHAAGRLYLAEKKFDEGIEQFEQALKDDPNNAQLHSDYGAALLEKGEVEADSGEAARSLGDLAKAFEHFTKALNLDGSLLEALFNRAICEQRMGLSAQAADDWRSYLEKDADSRWSDEARENLRRIEVHSVSQSPKREEVVQEFIEGWRLRDDERAWKALSRSQVRIGNFIVEILIDQYLALTAQGRVNEASTKLSATSYAGELQSRKVGDDYTLHIVRVYQSSTEDQRFALSQARALLRSGQTLIMQSDMKAAEKAYLEAERIFDQNGDKCESLSSEFWTGICRLETVPQQSAVIFARLVRICEAENYKWLLVRALNGLANHYTSLNEYSKVIRYAQWSKAVAEQGEDTYGLVLARAHLVGAYRSLGNTQECLTHLSELLTLSAEKPLEPMQRCLYYILAAWVLNSRGLNLAALCYGKAALELALALKETTMTCVSYTHCGMFYGKLGDYETALDNTSRAFEMAKSKSNEPAGLLMMAYSKLHIGSLYRQMGDWEKAIASYNESVAFYDQVANAAFVHQVHKGLFLAYAASANAALAKQELDKAILYYESNRSRILEQSNRNSFFDLEQDIYDVAIEFETGQMNEPSEAFGYSEMSRSRSLLDLVRKKGHIQEDGCGPDPSFSYASQPLSLQEVMRRLPDEVQIVQYAVLDDKLIVWHITKTEFTSFEKKIELTELDELVRNFVRLVSSPMASEREDLSVVSNALYKCLIEPVESSLDKHKQLLIVPDKSLNLVPFQALTSPTTGRYLIEDYVVALSPSSSLLVSCSEDASKKAHLTDERLLSVGIARVDHTKYKGLSDLPSAAVEARTISSDYKSAHVLDREHASKEELMNWAAWANVIHLASHFVTSTSSPLRSKLLLAQPAPGESGFGSDETELEASEVYRIKLPHAKLVVLSACRTGVEQFYRGEGAIGLARTFIAAGVPLVVASLWPVDSDSSAKLMVSFHNYRTGPDFLDAKQARGESVSAGLYGPCSGQPRSSAQSLRLAQLDMLNGPDLRYRHPYYWALFSVIGGYATF